MATSQNPMTGKMSGAMGNFVTSSLGSQNIVRTKAFNRKDAKTEAQVKQRDGFKMIADVYSALGGIPDEGFAQRSENTSVYAAFMAKNLSEAIDKSGDISVFDYTKLQLSDGNLQLPTIKEATLTSEGIVLKYLSKIRMLSNYPTDEMVAVLLLKSGEVWLERQARGEDAEGTLTIEATGITAEEIQGIYLFAKRADGSKTSKTVYISIN
jgi:hypothetical protein